MNAGLSSLAKLKANILPATMRTRMDFDDQLVSLGIGVAMMMEKAEREREERERREPKVLASYMLSAQSGRVRKLLGEIDKERGLCWVREYFGCSYVLRVLVCVHLRVRVGLT